MITRAQDAELAPKSATAVTDREARGDAGAEVYEISEADSEMVCVVLQGGETLYQPSHWGSEGVAVQG